MVFLQYDFCPEIELNIHIGNYSIAIKTIEENVNKENLSKEKYLSCRILKAIVLTKMGKYDQALEYSEENLEISQNLGLKKYLSDSILVISNILIHFNRLYESLSMLTRAETLINELPTNDRMIKQRKGILWYLNGKTKHLQGNFDQAIKDYLQSLSFYREINYKIGIAETLNDLGEIYFYKGDLYRAKSIFNQSLKIREKYNNRQEIASSYTNFGHYYRWSGKYGKALEYYLQANSLREEMGNKKEIAEALKNISVIYFKLGEINRALQYISKSLSLLEEIGNKRDIADSLSMLSRIYLIKGDLAQAQSSQNRSYQMRKVIGNKSDLATSFFGLGLISYHLGEYEDAREFLEKCYDIQEKYHNWNLRTETIFWLIVILTEQNEYETVWGYLEKLQRGFEFNENPIIEQRLEIATALLLKVSKKRSVLEKAVNELEAILKFEELENELKLIVLYHLCEVYIIISQIREENIYFNRIKRIISNHFRHAREMESQLYILENLLLKIKYTMLKNDVEEVKILLSQAKQLSEEKGFRRIALKVHDLEKLILDMKDGTTKLIIPHKFTSESIPKERVNDKIMRIAEKTTVVKDKIRKEEPVLFLVIAEGGITLFSRKFKTNAVIDEMFVGGFLTALNTFMHETFMTGGSIERIKHQEFTLLLKGHESLFFCYVFQGQSYTAVQKLNHIIKKITSLPVWNKLLHKNQEQLTSEEFKYLNNLADETFRQGRNIL
ncbi:MAG: tetratricopeptide repeat protein [Asgard group archaeon]|nr:tetratricopeptide repeat protein [Asgard group archaeon]